MTTFYGSRSHYRDHLEPIAALMGLEVHSDRRSVPEEGLVVVASYLDLWAFRRRDAVLVEHGAGQAYGKSKQRRHPSYSGGRGRENVVLFVCPSRAVVERNLEAYPKARAVAVGCPKMDRWHLNPVEPTVEVGFAFHWFTGGVAPEARSAFSHYRDGLEAVGGPGTLGTGHPRVLESLRRSYDPAGIPTVTTDEVFERCRVMVVDNSSVGWEFMSMDRPVIWLNAPWYRKTVEHGLRFWEYADSGIQVEGPDELPDAIALALGDPEPYRSRRREVIGMVYEHTDGGAAKRAAEAIAEVE